jgi:hypothetical protein
MSNTLTELDRLLAERAIERLLSIYVHNLDDGKFAENAELFSYGTFEIPAVAAKGREAVARFLESNVQRHGDATPRTWHSVSNPLIDIDPSGERATCVCYFTVHQELDGLPLQPIVTGRYHDAFERHHGKWRFASRKVVPHLIGNLRFHVASPAAEEVAE